MTLFIFANKLKRLYSINNREGKIEYVAGLCGRYFMFDALYDHLIEIGHDIKLKTVDGDENEAKKILWSICKNNAKLEKNYTKIYAEKLYKSELVYLWLVQNYNLYGQELKMRSESGDAIPALNWDSEYENNIKNYLEQKTLELTL